MNKIDQKPAKKVGLKFAFKNVHTCSCSQVFRKAVPQAWSTIIKNFFTVSFRSNLRN